MMLRAIRICAVSCWAILAFGCNDSPNPNRLLIDQAKACLAQANYVCARAKYKAVDTLEGDLYREKLAGLALTEMALWLKQAGEIIVDVAELINETANSGAPALQLAAGLQGDAILNRIVYNTTLPSWEHIQEVLAAFEAALAYQDDYDVHFNYLPLRIGNVPLVAFSGTFAKHDLALFKAWLHGAASSLAVVLAMDFDFPVGPLVAYALELADCNNVANSQQAHRCFMALTAFAVNNSPTLLKREATRGQVFQAEARAQLAKFYSDSEKFINSIENEAANDVIDRIFRWQDHQDGGWIAVRFAEVTLTVEQIKQLLTEDTILSPPYPAEQRDVRFVVDQAVRQYAGQVVTHLQTGVPPYVPLAATIIPTFATSAEIVLQSDVLINLGQIVLSALDPEFAEVVVQLFLRLQELYTDVSTADAVHELIAGLFPSSAEISYDIFLDSEVFLRAFVPDAVTTAVYNDSETLRIWRWQVEWECDLAAVDILGCAADSAALDVSHFVDGPVTLPADGIASRIGYVAYSDPSFNAMFRVNMSQVADDQPDELGVLDMLELNLLIQTIGGELIDRLDP